MRAFPWVVAGMGIGAGLTIMFMNEYKDAEARYAAGSATEEEWPLGKSFAWDAKGTKPAISPRGKVRPFAREVKEGVGRVTGDDQMVGEGVVDRAAVSAMDAPGDLGQSMGQVVGQTIHDLNR